MPEVVIRGGVVVDARGARRADVAIEDATIVAVEPEIDATGTGATVLDAAGCTVAPGLVDLHTHLREPGREEAETVASGSACAARGGFSAIVAMPNTDPAIDCAAVVHQVLRAGRAAGRCEVLTSAAITLGREGEQLAPMGELADLGVRLFTDDGAGVQDDRLMRRAMEYASDLGVVLAQHCEVEALAEGGHMHEGSVSSRLGIPGIPAEAEDLMVARDLALARRVGVPVHFQHLSTAGSVELVRSAKVAGQPVTAEATTHHFTLTDECCGSYDPVFKVNPPLRPATDVEAIRDGLADGTIDAIATDHAPHPSEAKELPFDQAPPGMLGLETAFALAWTELGGPEGLLGIEDLLALLSWRPARIARATRHGRPVVVGEPANLCVVDLEHRWVIERDATASRSRNNPYAGRSVQGAVRHTVYEGHPTVVDGSLGEPRPAPTTTTRSESAS